MEIKYQNTIKPPITSTVGIDRVSSMQMPTQISIHYYEYGFLVLLL